MTALYERFLYYRVGIALGYGLDDRGSMVRFPAGDGNFFSTTASRTAMGPTQPPVQWVRGGLYLGIKRPGREADHSPPSSAEVKQCVELYLYSPIRLHVVVLSSAQGQLYLYLYRVFYCIRCHEWHVWKHTEGNLIFRNSITKVQMHITELVSLIFI
jgi:hypothetical protein